MDGETRNDGKNKSKTFRVIGRGGLYGCEILRISHCLDIRLADGGDVVSLTHRSRSTSQKMYISASGYYFY
jgi:hypothetical protein